MDIMSNFFREAAMQATLLAPIMMDKEKLETDDVVGRELTIVAFDFAPKFDKKGEPIFNEKTGEQDTFGVVVFEEEPTKYYCVGTVFTKVCHSWMSGFDTPEQASEVLKSEGGVKVMFTQSKTKNGNNLTAVKVL